MRKGHVLIVIGLLTICGLWILADFLSVQNPFFTKATWNKNEHAPYCVILSGEDKSGCEYRNGIMPEWYKPYQLVRYALTGDSTKYEYLPIPEDHYITWDYPYYYQCDGVLPDNITIQEAIDNLPETGTETVVIYPNNLGGSDD